MAAVLKERLGTNVQATLLHEARALLQRAQARCQELPALRRCQLDALAQALLQSEVLCGDELKALLAAEPMMSSDAAALA